MRPAAPAPSAAAAALDRRFAGPEPAPPAAAESTTHVNGRFLLAAGGAALFTAAVLVVVTSDALSGRQTLWVDNLAQLLAPVLAAAACFWRGAAESGRPRRGWWLLGGSALAWASGQALWCWRELLEGVSLSPPTASDIGYLGAIPLALAALLTFFTAPAGLTSRLRASVDGVIVAGSMLLIAWATTLHSVDLSGRNADLLRQVLGLGYPMGDVAVLSVLLIVAGRSRSLSNTLLVWIGAGLGALAIADLGNTALSLTEAGGYTTGSPLDAGWVAGYLLIALAALLPHGYAQHPANQRRSSHDRTLLPYLALTGACGVIATRAMAGASPDAFELWNLLAVMLVLVIRQVLTLRENAKLNATLQARVEELGASERRFRSLIRNASDAALVVERDGRIAWAAPAVRRLFGRDPGELADESIYSILHPDDVELVETFLSRVSHQLPDRHIAAEFRLRHSRAGWREVEAFGANLSEDASVGGLVLNVRDISERKRFEGELEHQAFHDPLTGLPNRALFHDRVSHALASQLREGMQVAILFLDLDDFKNINDSLGHAAGDDVLEEVGRRLAECVRTPDTAARLGGDEFAVLIRDPDAEGVSVQIAERIRRALSVPTVSHGRELKVRASVGIAVGDVRTHAGSDADELLRQADLAMYRAKERGRGSYELYEPELHTRALARLEIKNELERALEQGELSLRYQPIVDTARHDIAGVEALVRWEHPERGLLSPAEFIPLAEETGLIVPLGRQVMREACAWLARAQRETPREPRLWVSVNVSAAQMQGEHFVAEVEHAVQSAGIEPGSLMLELTESTTMQDVDLSVARMLALRELGVRLAIDDFGTGYSSLNYVRRLPVDVLKIDRSFLADPTPQVAQLTAEMVQLGRIFEMKTIVEGVETESQLRWLEDLGCDYCQGFYLARPLEGEEILRLTAAREQLGAPAPSGAAAGR